MSELEKILKTTLSEQPPFYLVYGEEDYLINQFVEQYVEKFVDEDIKDFNLSFIDDSQKNFIQNLKNSLVTVPIMSKQRFVVANCEEYFVSKSSQDDKLISILTNIPETSRLIIAVYGKIDGRIKLNKTVKKVGQTVHRKPPRFQNLDNWIKEEFVRRGKQIDKKGISLLEHMFNNNLQQLSVEIDKIVTCFYEQEKITDMDIKKIVSQDRLLEDDVIFSFLDAFSQRNKGKALQILREMLYIGEYPLSILAMINRQLRLLISIKELKQEGNAPREIASILNQHPYPVKKCFSTCDNFSFLELEKFMERVLQANLELVTGRYQNKDLALELILLKM